MNSIEHCALKIFELITLLKILGPCLHGRPKSTKDG